MQPNDTTLAARFWAKVDKRGPTECWEWVRYLNVYGYGQFSVNARVTKLAHRMAYELMLGPIPDGLVIDHLCNNPRCVNPAHMEAVTQDVNAQRRHARTGCSPSKTRPLRHRIATHCKNGHELNEASILIRADGYVSCRICQRRHRLAHRDKLRDKRRVAALEG